MNTLKYFFVFFSFLHRVMRACKMVFGMFLFHSHAFTLRDFISFFFFILFSIFFLIDIEIFFNNIDLISLSCCSLNSTQCASKYMSHIRCHLYIIKCIGIFIRLKIGNSHLSEKRYKFQATRTWIKLISCSINRSRGFIMRCKERYVLYTMSNTFE